MLCQVVAVHKNVAHTFSKSTVPCVELVPGHGVREDAHFGVTVKHRSRVARDATQPNLRQVHLLHEELFAEVASRGLRVLPGAMGENVTTRGIDLLSLSAGTRLKLGTHAVIEITGLRNPCAQIENFHTGLLAAVLDRASDGSLVRKAGVMAVVLEGGFVRPTDRVEVAFMPHEHKPLQPV